MVRKGDVVAGSFEWIAPRYMEDFSCIGPDCESNCCHGWRIAVDESTYKRVKDSLRRNRSEREEFKQCFERNHNDKFGDGCFARLVMTDDGFCRFLDAGGLCSLHARFGALHIGLVCRNYPRLWSRLGQRLELFGDFSCPEVARRVLVAENPLELIDLADPPTDLASVLLFRNLRGEEPDPYLRYLDDIRQLGMHLLAAEQYPLHSRLFFLACFADSVTPFFYRDCQPFSEDKLAAVIQELAAPETLAEIHREFRAIDSRTDFSMDLVKKIIVSRFSVAHTDFGSLLERILENGAGEGGASTDDGGGSFQDFFEQRKLAAERLFGGRLNRYFENYCRNYWLGEWYVDSPDLSVHVRKLLVRLAVLRVLLFCHPGLNDILREAGDMATAEAQLDQAAIAVFSAFSRGVEHSQQFFDSIHKFLTESGHDNLAIQAMLLKV